jgi:hypothetical protein
MPSSSSSSRLRTEKDPVSETLFSSYLEFNVMNKNPLIE